MLLFSGTAKVDPANEQINEGEFGLHKEKKRKTQDFPHVMGEDYEIRRFEKDSFRR